MRAIVEKVLADARYQQNIKYGEPRPGHPEGPVSSHIAELEANLEALRPRLKSEAEYWKLKFLIHVHDAFKAEAEPDVAILHPRSHASLARAYAAQLTGDEDLLNMLQYHDENYALWQQFSSQGAYDQDRLRHLIQTIQDWNLFLAFLVIDGCTAGKDRAKLAWFIHEVEKYKHIEIDETWVLS